METDTAVVGTPLAVTPELGLCREPETTRIVVGKWETRRCRPHDGPKDGKKKHLEVRRGKQEEKADGGSTHEERDDERICIWYRCSRTRRLREFVMSGRKMRKPRD